MAEVLTDSLRETLDVFERAGVPQTTSEVAEALDLGRRSTYDRLQRLVDGGRLDTKKVGSSGRVWWRPPSSTADGRQPNRSQPGDALITDVLAAADIPIFALDRSFDVAWVNDHAAELLDGRGPTLVGQSVESALSMDEDDQLQQELRAAMESQESRRCERYAESRDRWEEARIFPSETGLSVSLTDITDRKRRERELVRYKTLFEESRDVNVVLDRGGHFKTVSTSSKNVLGYAPAELEGENGFDYIHPDDREHARREVAAMLASPEYEPTTEFRLECSDGSYVTVEAHARNLLDDPDVDGIVVYSRDVTERKERKRALERQLRQQEVVTELGQRALEGEQTDEIVRDAARLVAETLDTDYCKVLDLDEESDELLLRAGVGWNEGIVGSATVSAVEADSQAAYTLETSDPVVVTDLHTETRFSGPELLRDHAVRSGISVVIGPVDDPWGILGTHDTERRTFSQPDINFVQSVANVLAGMVSRQASEAELRRQRTEQRERERALRQAYEVLADPDQPLSAQLDDLVDVVCETVETEHVTIGHVREDEYVFDYVAGAPDKIRPGTAASLDAVPCREQVVATGSRSVRDAGDGAESAAPHSPPATYLGVPLAVDGRVYGVFSCFDGTDAERSYTDWEVAFLELLGNWVSNELERRQYTDQLAALNDLNAIAREITDAVIDHSTRNEIEATVCEHLAATDSYEFAWIGDVDAGSKTVNLRAEAGVEGYLDGVTISVDPDDERSVGPTAVALRTGEMQVVTDTRTDERHDPWRNHVDQYDFRSSAAIPIVHEDSIYGVLNLYAARQNAFEGEERAVIRQLGEVVGHAIAATDRKKALMSDEVVELDFQIQHLAGSLSVDTSLPGRIELTDTVPVEDGRYLLYGSATEEGIESLQTLLDAFPHWESVTVREGVDQRQFELTLSEPPVLAVLASVGGYIEDAVIENGDMRLCLHLSPSADVRRVIDVVQEAYPTAELLKRHQVRREQVSSNQIQRVLTSDLTERQRSALEAAYHAGFFDWPRDVSGGEMAESLGVSSPTFHQHLRKAEQKILDTLLSSASTMT